MAFLEVELDVAGVGDLLAALDGGRVLGKEPIHLFGRADVEEIAAVAHAVLVAAQPPGVDAQQHVVGRGVALAKVVRVAGGHQRQTELVGDVDGPLGADLLDVQTVVLDLDEEVLSKDIGEPLCHFARLSSSWSLRINSLNSEERSRTSRWSPS